MFKRWDNVKRGFTLIELLVVVSIIALLVSILLPALSKARETTKLILCSNNVRQIVMAEGFYALDYRDRLPPINFSQMYDLYGIKWPPDDQTPFGDTVWTEAIEPYIPQAQYGQEDYLMTCPNFARMHPGIEAYGTAGTPYGMLGAADNNQDGAVHEEINGVDYYGSCPLNVLRVKHPSGLILISESYWHPWWPTKTAWMICGPVNPANCRQNPELRHQDRFPVGFLDGHAASAMAKTHPVTDNDPPVGQELPIYWPDVGDSSWLTW